MHCCHTPPHRYYRDAQQTEPEVEDTEDLVNAHGGALDPQELLRVAEEQANVDQVSKFRFARKKDLATGPGFLLGLVKLDYIT